MPPTPQYPYSHFAPPPNALIQTQASPIEESLIPENLQPGQDITIAEFCATYQLDDDVLKKFNNEGYRMTFSFQHILIPDLFQAQFRRGDVAELKSAVLKWTKHRAQ